jgi:hypothetical protein
MKIRWVAKMNLSLRDPFFMKRALTPNNINRGQKVYNIEKIAVKAAMRCNNSGLK